MRYEYARRPDLYDLEYSFKDYAVEVERIEAIVRARNPDARTLLDVACGTGRHLELLRERFETVEGVDADEGMLAVARERLPGVALHQGDMRTFDLGHEFDAVTCLFSSIGFAHDLEQLDAAAQHLAAHLAPGGVLVVEPWITPDEWRPSRPHVLSAEGGGVVLARVTVSGREGRLATMEMHYALGTPDGIETWDRNHALALFTVDEMRTAFEDAGLEVEHDPEGLMGRGLYICTQGGRSV
jgi:SAM-dependent methyltransferase